MKSFNNVWTNIHNQLELSHRIKIEQAKLKFKLEKEYEEGLNKKNKN
jgi:hypothetical protein